MPSGVGAQLGLGASGAVAGGVIGGGIACLTKIVNINVAVKKLLRNLRSSLMVLLSLKRNNRN